MARGTSCNQTLIDRAAELYVSEGYSVEEAAEHVGLPYNTIKRHSSKGKWLARRQKRSESLLAQLANPNLDREPIAARLDRWLELRAEHFKSSLADAGRLRKLAEKLANAGQVTTCRDVREMAGVFQIASMLERQVLGLDVIDKLAFEAALRDQQQPAKGPSIPTLSDDRPMLARNAPQVDPLLGMPSPKPVKLTDLENGGK